MRSADQAPKDGERLLGTHVAANTKHSLDKRPDDSSTETDKDFLTRAEAAAYLTARGLRITKNTLQKMATTGGGPPYRKFGFRVLYTPGELIDWALAKLGPEQRSSSDAA